MCRDVIQGSFRSGIPRFTAPPAAYRPRLQSTGAQQRLEPAALIQRHASVGTAYQAPPSLARSGRGGGQRLPEPLRQKMESVLGADFSDVRVHVGTEAGSIGALAFTHGSNLYFAPGQYDPHTPRGHQLLGHELTHVLQQRAGRVRNPFGAGVAVVHDQLLEAEADRMGQRAAAQPATRVQASRPGSPLPSVHPRVGPHRVAVAQPSFAKYRWLLHDKNVLTDKADKRLREGQAAIVKTRAKLQMGAGNIKQQVSGSSGLSFVQTEFVKQTATEYGKSGVAPLEAWAIAARRGTAGNCDEFAAVTYFYLLEMNISDDVSVVGLPQVGHHFVMIGDVTNPEADEAVVVDPWPAKGFAVLYTHWDYKGQQMKVTLGPTRSTGQTPLKAARTSLKLAKHTRQSFDKGVKDAYAKYGTGEEMIKKIKEVHQAGSYFWGNEHTLADENVAKLDALVEQKRRTVTDPLGMDQYLFDALFK